MRLKNVLNISEEEIDKFFISNIDKINSIKCKAILPKASNFSDVLSYKTALEKYLSTVDELKNFCSISSAGMAWFDKHFNHCFNSHNPDFSIIEQTRENYKDLINNYEKYNEYFKQKQELDAFLTSNSNYIKEQIIELVKTNSGILQKDMYKYFKPEHKKAVIQILQSLLKKKRITRVKHGNTFELYLNN